MGEAFQHSAWVWHPQTHRNQFVLFTRNLDRSPDATEATVRITASTTYELWVDGEFVARGPVHGDPKWCLFDEFHIPLRSGAAQTHLAVLVHNETGVAILNRLPAPGGLRLEIEVGGSTLGTDASWRALDLPMWRDDALKRGWALGACEDYDARTEPEGWGGRLFPQPPRGSVPAVPVPEADTIWQGYELRPTPMPVRRPIAPVAFDAFQAPDAPTEDIADASVHADEETLIPIQRTVPFSAEAVTGLLVSGQANAFTLDLGQEYIGFYDIELAAPAGLIVEVFGAELLREGRPWVLRKHTRYSVRYRTREGRQRFTSFNPSGFRYLHVVFRESGGQETVFYGAGCLEHRIPLPEPRAVQADDPALQAVVDLCVRTLQVGVQEHLIDCPTREQAQYFGDGLFIAQSLLEGFGDRRYLEWYLDCFLHVPFRADGQISCVYPGNHKVLLDYSLIPLIGQSVYREATGGFYRPEVTLEKGLRLKEWYDARRTPDGLVYVSPEECQRQDLVNFIDHAGLGWHNFPHPGIDREGVSAPLNMFYFAFTRTLAQLADAVGSDAAEPLHRQAGELGDTLRSTFFDGTVFHDAIRDGVLSRDTSWQTNGLAVYLDLLQGSEARKAMQAMIEGYDRLCRCSPYFHFFFLPALRKAGLEADARALIVREWGPMVAAGATTTWEGFAGDELDSLCHPWSTAPYLFMLGADGAAR
jgi:hypothetical protein